MASSIGSFLETLVLACALCACASAATPSPTPGKPMTTHTIEAAEFEFDNANRLVEAHDWVGANGCLKRGLADVGDDYVPDGVIDETGTRLVLADAKEREGDLPMAIRLRQRVLENRIALWKQKLGRAR